MVRWLAVFGVALLSGCSHFPPHDPAKAWVNIYSYVDNQLLADQVDGQPWPADDYFQVTPGTHTLGLNYQYWTDAGYGREPLAQSCDFTLSYETFRADKEYQLVAGWNPDGAWLRLLDERGDQLAYETCGSF